jgi:hypothetical protein
MSKAIWAAEDGNDSGYQPEVSEFVFPEVFPAQYAKSLLTLPKLTSVHWLMLIAFMMLGRAANAVDAIKTYAGLTGRHPRTLNHPHLYQVTKALKDGGYLIQVTDNPTASTGGKRGPVYRMVDCVDTTNAIAKFGLHINAQRPFLNEQEVEQLTKGSHTIVRSRAKKPSVGEKEFKEVNRDEKKPPTA